MQSPERTNEKRYTFSFGGIGSLYNVELYQNIENTSLYLSKQSYQQVWKLGSKNALALAGVPEEKQHLILNQQNLYYGNCYFFDYAKSLTKYENYDYVVCDEAHYFLMDSNYNANTIISYKFIQAFFNTKIRIFMFDTIDEIKQYIEKSEAMDRTYCTLWYDYKYYSISGLLYRPKHIKYVQDVNYDYIDVKVIYNLKEIASLIVNGTTKWLIFVDSKEFRNKLKTQISKLCAEYEKNVSVSFVTADYVLDDESKHEVEQITEKSKQSAKGLKFRRLYLRSGKNLVCYHVDGIVPIKGELAFCYIYELFMLRLNSIV